MRNLRKCVECGKEKDKDQMVGNNIWGKYYDEKEHERFMDYRCESCFDDAVEYEREQGLRI